MHFTEFSKVNKERCESGTGFAHNLETWSLSDWFLALTGELGEAANVAKKLNRYRDGIPGNTETLIQLQDKLADELADTFIYLDLLIQAAGFDITEIVANKFNRTSEKMGYAGRLGA